MPTLDNMKCILLAAAPQQVAKPVERAAKDAVKNVKQAVKAPAPKSAVKEAPKVADKVKSSLVIPYLPALATTLPVFSAAAKCHVPSILGD